MATIEAAMRRLEAPAKREAEAERQRRAEAEVERQRWGQKRRGRAPQPVDETPEDHAQSHCTDPARPSMRTNNKGWDSCGHAPASVDGAYQIIVACDVTDATNDKQQAAPLAHAPLETREQAGMARPPAGTGAPAPIPATLDNGYDSEAAGQALEGLGFDPYIATGRVRHHGEPGEGVESSSTAQERRAAKGRTPEGRALYGKRTVIVEPVFGQSKEGRGFRRFLLRGMPQLRGEWRWVCLTHNLLQIWRYGCALMAA